MAKLSKKEVIELANFYGYQNLPERYYVMDREFDIKDDDVIIDGGSFQGDMAVYFSKRAPEGRIYCFEALPTNRDMILMTISHFDLSNVRLLPYALWNENRILKFYISDHINAGSLLKDFRKVDKDKNIDIAAATIDSIVKKYSIKKVNHIWFNIEGAEVKALKGAKKTLKNNDVDIIVSTHVVNDKYSTTEDVIKLLKSYGFKTKHIKNHEKWIYGWKTK